MNPFHALSAVVLTIAVALLPAGRPRSACARYSVAAPERGRDLAVTVWYPADAGGEAGSGGRQQGVQRRAGVDERAAR